MTAPLMFTIDAAPSLADALAARAGLGVGAITVRRFPDAESYVRFDTPVAGRDVVLLCTLDRADEKTLALIFAADAARGQGARSVGLVAPYLGYMRQDKAFQPGEAVTSVSYGAMLSRAVDWLVTVDPHLHRHPTLDVVYAVPAFALTAATAVAEWLKAEVVRPVLIGPDEESAQWVERIAALARARATVLRKTRRGDYDVAIAGEVPEIGADETPVIVDDIASSARTMIEAVERLRAATGRSPVCIAVHPVFAGDAHAALSAAGPLRIVSTDSIAHPTNAIGLAPLIAPAIAPAIAAGLAAKRG